MLPSGKLDDTGRVAAKVQGHRQKPVSAFRPHLTFYGSAVPSEFLDTITAQMIKGGLMGRLLFPTIIPGALVDPAPASLPVPDSIIVQVRQWAEVAEGAGPLDANSPLPRVVPFTGEARDLWNAYRKRCHPRSVNAEDDLAATLWNRAAEKAARLSLISAASREGPQVAAISDDDVVWACEIVDFYTDQMIALAGRSIATNEVERRRCKFLEVMRKYLERHPGEALLTAA